jgi:NitT/TauT family transport system permease protein
MNVWAKRATAAFLVLAAWEAGVKLSGAAPWLYPVPSGVVASIAQGLRSEYPLALAASFLRIAAGFGIAALAGLALGLLLAGSRSARELVGPVAIGVQALPSICWLPLAVLWFGLSESAILFVVVMGSLFSVALGVRDGITQLPPLYTRVGRTFGLTRWQQVTRITLPGALPAILSGLKQGWSFGWRSLMAGELIHVSTGLGKSLLVGRELNDVNQVCAVMALIVAFGVLIDRAAFGTIEQKMLAKRGLA